MNRERGTRSNGSVEAELQRLCREAAADRELIAEGRIDELPDRIAERQEAFETLRAKAPPSALATARCRALIAELNECGAGTIALLSSFREELAEHLEHGRSVRQAAGRYECSGRL